MNSFERKGIKEKIIYVHLRKKRKINFYNDIRRLQYEFVVIKFSFSLIEKKLLNDKEKIKIIDAACEQLLNKTNNE